MKALGLMSGTSLDGIDAALLEIEDGCGEPLRWSVIAAATTPYTAEQRDRIRSVISEGGADTICRLHADLGEWFARAARAVLDEAGVAATDVHVIGSHGQTLWHEPPGSTRGATLQIGCPATIAERTGIDVVSDFRTRDVAAGGHGAPLVPFADAVLFGDPVRARALQNLGGMANVTWLGPEGEVFAFDTGPGNALMDHAAECATGGTLRFDDGGRMAARGSVDEELLASLIAHPFFQKIPPRSTGREVFGEAFVEALAEGLPHGSPSEWESLVATLTAFTARAIGDAYRAWVIPRGLDEVYLLGGGARNPTLVRMIREELADVTVLDGSALGIDPDAREAAAFAVLAWAHVSGRAGNVPAATAASGPRVLGSLTPGGMGGRG